MKTLLNYKLYFSLLSAMFFCTQTFAQDIYRQIDKEADILVKEHAETKDLGDDSETDELFKTMSDPTDGNTSNVTGDNLGDHTATQALDMDTRNINDISYVNIRKKWGYGIRFWNNNHYKISLRNNSYGQYGPVDKVSMKFNVNTPQGYGWTWGKWAQTPIAALSNEGNMQIAGSFTAMDQINVGVENPSTFTNIAGDPYRMYVAGGALFEEVKVETGWADYVFENDYNLQSLEQVEAFISENGHLPNTPSALEIEEAGGVDLGAATVKQQEKIEELFLHMIEMNESLKTLKAENAELKAQVNKLSK